jgi:hypothetical protein
MGQAAASLSTGAVDGSFGPSIGSAIKDLQGDAYKLDAPPEAPKIDNQPDAVEKVADEQKKARGRASTILTGKRGLMGDPQTARRTLLGV